MTSPFFRKGKQFSFRVDLQFGVNISLVFLCRVRFDFDPTDECARLFYEEAKLRVEGLADGPGIFSFGVIP